MYSSVNMLRRDARKRLRRGEHLVLYGSIGSGKSTLLSDLAAQLSDAGLSCTTVKLTQSLHEIAVSLEQTYAQTDPGPGSMPEEAERRILEFAQSRGGILLLDHLIELTDGMVNFLRQCRGGHFGVLVAVDTEVELERKRLRPGRLGALAMKMPPFPAETLREQLRAKCIEYQIPALTPDVEGRLLREARGRPGWIERCVELQRKGLYRQGDQVFVTALCEDTEAALHEKALNMLRVAEIP